MCVCVCVCVCENFKIPLIARMKTKNNFIDKH